MTLRARIGYTSVAYVTEIFPRVFYDMVPNGVLLQILTQQVTSHTPRNMERIHAEARAAAKAITFGMQYGMGDRTLAERLGLTVPEARERIVKWEDPVAAWRIESARTSRRAKVLSYIPAGR